MSDSNGHHASSHPGVVLLFGAPGSGKGTQGSRLAAQLGIPCLSTGDLLRAEAQQDTPTGRQLREVMASGALVSDEMVCAVVEALLERGAADHGLILDGFPRTVAQAKFLDRTMANMGLPRPTVLHLEVSVEGMVRRLTARRQCPKCKSIYNLISRPSLLGDRCENDGETLVTRADDNEATIVHRLEEFDRLSKPVIDYYQGPGYHRVDGDRDLDVVANELTDICHLAQLETRSFGD